MVDFSKPSWFAEHRGLTDYSDWYTLGSESPYRKAVMNVAHLIAETDLVRVPSRNIIHFWMLYMLSQKGVNFTDAPTIHLFWLEVVYVLCDQYYTKGLHLFVKNTFIPYGTQRMMENWGLP